MLLTSERTLHVPLYKCISWTIQYGFVMIFNKQVASVSQKVNKHFIQYVFFHFSPADQLLFPNMGILTFLSDVLHKAEFPPTLWNYFYWLRITGTVCYANYLPACPTADKAERARAMWIDGQMIKPFKESSCKKQIFCVLTSTIIIFKCE